MMNTRVVLKELLQVLKGKFQTMLIVEKNLDNHECIDTKEGS